MITQTRLTLIAGALFAALVICALVIASEFNPDEIPKIVGAAFGAFVSGSLAILLFYMTQIRDGTKSELELFRLRRAYWHDTFTTLPVVYEEWLYWKTRSGQQGETTAQWRTRSMDLIIEHLRSSFYEANLGSLPRIPIGAQANLMMFHDDLRIVCERIKQLTPLVEKYEGALAAGVDFSTPLHIASLIDIAELSKGLAELLESVLLYGWAAQTDLDQDGVWRSEYYAGDDGSLPRPTPAWIGGILALAQQYKKPLRRGPQDDTQ
jgi:hypothetical protein